MGAILRWRSRWRRFLAWSRRQLSRPQPPPPPRAANKTPTPLLVEYQPTPEQPPKPKPLRRKTTIQEADNGQFYFRGAILDQLDLYAQYVRRMKRTDKDAYGLYSKIGAMLGPHIACHERGTELSPWFQQTLPGFGAVCLSVLTSQEQHEHDEGKVCPRFLYFTKYKKPPTNVQTVATGNVYVVTAYFDSLTPFDGEKPWKTGIPVQFPVVIDQHGNVEPLRTRLTEQQIIKHRNGEATAVTHQRWGIPKEFLDWAAENDIEPRQFLREIFVRAANLYESYNSSMIRVTAKRGGITAVFSVDALRTPYFFKDRDTVVNEKGKTARIFHIVRAHQRHLKSGETRSVRTHFAGLRRFKWHGYDIHITVPGRDHTHVAEINVGAEDEEWAIPGADYTDLPQVGAWLADHVETGKLDGGPRSIAL